MHKKQIDKSCEGVEPLSQRTLHPMVTHGLDLQITHQFKDAKKNSMGFKKEGNFFLKGQIGRHHGN
jgi:hypothetical protein